MAPPVVESHRRGRPRSEKARDAILAAAAELLIERGLAAVSMDAVAVRAGVSKATIYRWWPTKETLALDTLYNEWVTVRPPLEETGSLRGDLLGLLRPWIRLLATRPYGRVIAALDLPGADRSGLRRRVPPRLIEPRRDQARPILERAMERGELPSGTNVELALDLLYGPLYHRLLQGHAPLDDPFVCEVVDTVLIGLQGQARDEFPNMRKDFR